MIGLEGRLVDQNWHQNLPVQTLARTLDLASGVVAAEYPGEPLGSVHSPILTRVVTAISAVLDGGRVVFIAAKLLKKGCYRENDVDARDRCFRQGGSLRFPLLDSSNVYSTETAP